MLRAASRSRSRVGGLNRGEDRFRGRGLLLDRISVSEVRCIVRGLVHCLLLV